MRNVINANIANVAADRQDRVEAGVVVGVRNLSLGGFMRLYGLMAARKSANKQAKKRLHQRPASLATTRRHMAGDAGRIRQLFAIR